jgi:rSAM/selenodomain-associated transferase 2
MRRFALLTACYALILVRMAFSGPVGRTGIEFCLLYAGAFACLFGMVRFFPAKWDNRQTLFFVFGLGIAGRFLFLWFPVSFDVHRYIWEGFLQNQGINPYLAAPASPMLQPFVVDDIAVIWEHINHKDLSAGYPPLTLLFFRLLAVISISPLFFKAFIVVIDAFVLIPLALLFRQKKIPMVRLLWYAANPLILVFIAGEGHLDSLMVALLCTGLALVLTTSWTGAGFFLIGCAGMSKYLAFGALIFLVRKDNWRRLWLAFMPLLFYLPFAKAGKALFASIGTFGSQFHYNDSLTVLLRGFLGGDALAGALAMLLLGWACILWVEHDRLRCVALSVGFLLICLPTLHPWYLLLVAPFAAAYASPPWLLLQATIVFTFPVLIQEFHTGVFQEIHWLKLFEYIPFYALLGWYGWRYSGVRLRRFKPVHSLSVVIPSLNEGAAIGDSILSVKGQAAVMQLIVADGGSTDDTTSIAARMGAEVVHAKKGRGHQIADGIKQASGDLILILHADCRLRAGAIRHLVESVNKHPYAAGGAMRMRFQPDNYRKRWIARLNNWRCRWTGIAFGDQGQFIRKEALPLMGGYPRQMLMEDVELALRSKTIGLTVFLGHQVHVSGRRWDDTRFAKNLLTILRLFFSYLLERRWGGVETEAKRYYQRYYYQK